MRVIGLSCGSHSYVFIQIPQAGRMGSVSCFFFNFFVLFFFFEWIRYDVLKEYSRIGIPDSSWRITGI